MKMFYENNEFRRILGIMTEWRGEKTGSAFSWSLRRKSDVVPVTRYFHAITAFFLPSRLLITYLFYGKKIILHTIEM